MSETKTYKGRLIFAAVVTLAAAGLRIACRQAAGFSDIYADLMNAFWVNTLGRLSGFFSFSLAEILILLILAAILMRSIRIIVSLVTKRNRKKLICGGLSGFLCLASVIFLLFECGEDVYFYRTPFSAHAGYGNGSYTTEELAEVCEVLAAKCNEYADDVERNEYGIMLASPDLPGRVRNRMGELGEEYDWLGGWYPRPKGLIFSRLMSLTGMAGIYSAYTSEANYNTEMAPYNFAFTMSHELSHLKGILPENEANFIAYLSCIGADDADILYSGAVSGWIYCGNELYKRDKELWSEIHESLDPSVRTDLKYNTAFWDHFKGKASEAAESFNDSYLKSAGQADGTESYNKVVDLIVSFETGRRMT